VAAARAAAQSLSQRLDDVLDTARLDAGGLQLRPQDTDLRALVTEVLTAQRRNAKAKGLGFDLAFDSAVPARICIDPQRVKQLLTQLLSNAVAFTHAGRVGLRVALSTRVVGRPALMLQVSDTGLGISAEDQKRLFEPFAVLAGNAGQVKGSGLGLPMCRRLVELMGGRISVHSEPGVGSRFSLRLPLREAVQAGADTAPVATSDGAAEPAPSPPVAPTPDAAAVPSQTPSKPQSQSDHAT